MGYRSNVYIKVSKHDEDKLTDLFRDNDITADKEYEDGDYVGYVIYDIKWYSSYTDVTAVNDFINEKSEYPRALVAVGEDNATEEYGLPYETGMYAYTSINWGD